MEAVVAEVARRVDGLVRLEVEGDLFFLAVVGYYGAYIDDKPVRGHLRGGAIKRASVLAIYRCCCCSVSGWSPDGGSNRNKLKDCDVIVLSE